MERDLTLCDPADSFDGTNVSSAWELARADCFQSLREDPEQTVDSC